MTRHHPMDTHNGVVVVNKVVLLQLVQVRTTSNCDHLVVEMMRGLSIQYRLVVKKDISNHSRKWMIKVVLWKL